MAKTDPEAFATYWEEEVIRLYIKNQGKDSAYKELHKQKPCYDQLTLF